MAPPNKSKTKAKSNRTQPQSTSTLAQPVVEDASYLTTLSSFSASGKLFAFLSFAVDKHRLRVYDTVTGQSVAEHIVDSARVTALTWDYFGLSDGRPGAEGESAQPNKKKRKKRNSQAADAATHTDGPETVVLGLSDGSILLFSPSHGRVIRTLSHSASTSSILAIAVTESTDGSQIIWASGADGAVRLWNAQKNDILGSWKSDDRIPYTSISIRPASHHDEDGRVDILVANHSIRLLTTNVAQFGSLSTQKPQELAKFTGHASSIRHLQWDASQNPSNRFLSAAENDRFVYIWQVPDVKGGLKEGTLLSSTPLDTDVRNASLSISSLPSSSKTEWQNLLTVSASGQLRICPVPSELTPNSSKQVPVLLSRSSVTAVSKKNDTVLIVGAAFLGQDDLKVARVIGGIRPVFHLVKYINDSGNYIGDITLDAIDLALVGDNSSIIPNKRYAENAGLAIRSGVELGQNEDLDDLAPRTEEGDLDVDLAELSLGQRLTALSGTDGPLRHASTSDSDDDAPAEKPPHDAKRRQHELSVVPANSLTRTLIQALHSSDSKLLETCLAHSDVTLIRNTVRRLPPQLAVPLITACVERLGRGARAGNMKGGGGGASSQRATGLIAWIKTVLAVHSGHLMTMPDLVARLAGLHATLTTRLSLQESLLSLSGRLDMVLSQIEMRSSTAPATLAPQKQAAGAKEKKVTHYVEGESDDEDEEDQMDVEIEVDDDAGSVEDVELGLDSQDEEDEDEENSEEEDDDDDDEGPTLNGFIDDEAEEFSEEEEDDSE